jgi:DnaD/phage-associated family protein
MTSFEGFPPGALKSTPLPNLFFRDLLPQIESLAELKVTLHVFWAICLKKGFPRFVTLRELRADGILRKGLSGAGRAAEEALSDGLALAVARGTLLHLPVELNGDAHDVYFLNTAHSRQAIAKLRSGELDIGQVVLDGEAPAAAIVEQPNIFTLYEQNIGLLTPLLAEELADAARVYPAHWIEDAFRQALGYNKRSWRYIQRILERWAIEGRGNEESRGSARRIGERATPYGRGRTSSGKR